MSDSSLWGVAKHLGIPQDGQSAPIDPLPSLIRDAAHELVLAGVLRESGRAYQQKYSVTYYGLRRLQEDDAELIADPDGVAEAFLQEFNGVDRAPLLARYLGQAKKCERQGMELAGATMIGCAYELAVVQLADALVNRWPDGAVKNLAGAHVNELKKYQDARDDTKKMKAPPKAGNLLDAVKAALEAVVNLRDGTLDDKYESWIGHSLGASFNFVREMRNDAGHPSGRTIPLDDLHDDVARFRRDYRKVRGIIDALTE